MFSKSYSFIRTQLNLQSLHNAVSDFVLQAKWIGCRCSYRVPAQLAVSICIDESIVNTYQLTGPFYVEFQSQSRAELLPRFFQVLNSKCSNLTCRDHLQWMAASQLG